jgi:hypothetical protein
MSTLREAVLHEMSRDALRKPQLQPEFPLQDVSKKSTLALKIAKGSLFSYFLCVHRASGRKDKQNLLQGQHQLHMDGRGNEEIERNRWDGFDQH